MKVRSGRPWIYKRRARVDCAVSPGPCGRKAKPSVNAGCAAVTAYTFVPSSQPQQIVDWSDPSIWAGGVAPDDPSADVVITAPPVSAGYAGAEIGVSNAYTINSLSLAANFLTFASGGSLTVAGAVDVFTSGEIDGGSLAAGSLTNDGQIQGATITCTGKFLNEVGGTIFGVNITAGPPSTNVPGNSPMAPKARMSQRATLAPGVTRSSSSWSNMSSLNPLEAPEATAPSRASFEG